MDHDNSIPYYASNLAANHEEIFRLLSELIQGYGSEKNSNAVIAGNNIPATLKRVEWTDAEVLAEYKVEQFSGDSKTQFGDHLILTTTETIGDEQEIKQTVFSWYRQSNNAKNTVQVQSRMLQRTKANQEAYDAWWAANKRDSGNGIFVAMKPDTTDELAYESELLLATIEKAEALLLDQPIL